MIDQRQQSIVLGQSSNLAMQYLLNLKKEYSVEDFNALFIHQSKRFFKLLMILQEELESVGGMKK